MPSQLKCFITIPWGRHPYTRLHMGLSSSTEMFQERMSWLVQELENVFVYVDDFIIITSGSYDEHLKKVDIVLQCLSKGGLKIKPNKCKWAMSEL